MAKTHTNEVVSPYYPPRARWWSRLLFPWFRIQRALHMENLHLPGGISTPKFFLSLAVPGFSFHALGKQIYGAGIFAGYCAAWLIFLAALGHVPANFAFGLMIAAHSISIFYLILPWMSDKSVQSRVLTAFLTLLAVSLAIYLPLIFYLQRHWFLPLRVDGRILVISPGGSPDVLQRGDIAAFRISYDSGNHSFTQSGYACGPVLGLPGDTVQSMQVPEKHWLIRTEFGTYYTHRGPGGTVQQLTLVSPDQFVGRPFKHWFFRKQKVQNS